MLLAMAAVLLAAVPRTIRFIFWLALGTLKHIQLYTISTKDTILTILPSPILLLIGPSANSSSQTLPTFNIDLATRVIMVYLSFLLGLGTLVSVVGWYHFGSNGTDLSVTPSALNSINGTPLNLASFPAAIELGKTALDAFVFDVHLSELEEALQDAPSSTRESSLHLSSFSGHKDTLSFGSDDDRGSAMEANDAVQSDFDLSDLEDVLKDVPRPLIESLRSPSPSSSGSWDSLFDDSNRDSGEDDPFAMSFASSS